MSRTPRRPRSVARSTEVADPAVAGRRIVPPQADPRQPDLFVPGFIPPCKPKLSTRVPVGDLWQYEVKLDGYRVQAHLHDGRVKLYSKSGKTLTSCLPGISRDLEAIGRRSVVLDGEAVMVDEHGRPDFFALHAAMANFRAPDAILFAFDILQLDGRDLRPLPLAERRAVLVELLIGTGPALHLSEHHVGDGPALLAAACEMGLEGVVAKRRDAPYRAGYVDTWIKVKCTVVASFAVIGFDPAGPRGVSSLKLARLDGDRLVRCGSAGSGIGAEASAGLRRALDAGQHVVADVEHRGMTPAGELRHPVFKGWHAE